MLDVDARYQRAYRHLLYLVHRVNLQLSARIELSLVSVEVAGPHPQERRRNRYARAVNALVVDRVDLFLAVFEYLRQRAPEEPLARPLERSLRDVVPAPVVVRERDRAYDLAGIGLDREHAVLFQPVAVRVVHHVDRKTALVEDVGPTNAINGEGCGLERQRFDNNVTLVLKDAGHVLDLFLGIGRRFDREYVVVLVLEAPRLVRA